MDTYVIDMMFKNLFIFISGLALGILLFAYIANRAGSKYEVPKMFILLTGFLTILAMWGIFFIALP